MELIIKHKPLISIIIPVYNGAQTIRNAICSVQEQMYSNVEIIVVDNGSIDNTKQLVTNFSKNDSRIKLIQSEKGRSIARNKGLKEANGKYINFLDADDRFTNKHIERAINFLENSIACFAYIEGAEFILKDGSSCQQSYENSSVDLEIANPFEISAVTFRNIDVRNFLENLDHNEDWLFWIQNLRNKQIITRFDLIGEQKYITGTNTMLDLDNMIGSELLVAMFGNISRTLKKQIKLMLMFLRSKYSKNIFFKKKVRQKYKLAYLLVSIGNHIPFIDKQIEKQMMKNIVRIRQKMMY